MTKILVGISSHSRLDDAEVQRQIWDYYSRTTFKEYEVEVMTFRSSGGDPTVQDVGFRHQAAHNIGVLLQHPADYYFFMNEDCWVVNPLVLEAILFQLWQGKKFAGSDWWESGDWAFCLSFCAMSKALAGLKVVSDTPRPVETRMGMALQAHGVTEEQLFRLSPREGVANRTGPDFSNHESTRSMTLSLSLLEHHDPYEKREYLRFSSLPWHCPKLMQLMTQGDLSTWNQGAQRGYTNIGR